MEAVVVKTLGILTVDVSGMDRLQWDVEDTYHIVWLKQ